MNPTAFEEIQLIGSKKIIKHIEAKLFPEKTFIHDLIFNYAAMADEIGESDYLNAGA
jgi:hypothetical protein